MADEKQYFINIQGTPIEVTPEVYYAYFRMERQERGQEEKKQRNHVVSYDALDTEGMSGVECIPDVLARNLEDIVITQELYSRIHRAIDTLPKAERELIQAIYFDGMSTRKYAALAGTSQTGVSYRLRKILSKLRKMIDFMGSL